MATVEMYWLQLMKMTGQLDCWDAIPYIVIVTNCLLFRMARHWLNRMIPNWLQLLAQELISTLELCAQCAELNIVYDLHGSLCYGISLCLLTIWWSHQFGDAQTSPAYVMEDLILQPDCRLLKGALFRLMGQSLALPLATRFAHLYWRYHLHDRHQYYDYQMNTGLCKSALTTTTLLGFLWEFNCCSIIRYVELWVRGSSSLSSMVATLIEATISTLLVVAAIDHSGGYMNPVLASSLEYGCEGTTNYQHLIIFWLAPLLAHLVARKLYAWQMRDSRVRHQKRVTTTTTVTHSFTPTMHTRINHPSKPTIVGSSVTITGGSKSSSNNTNKDQVNRMVTRNVSGQSNQRSQQQQQQHQSNQNSGKKHR